MQEMEIDLQGWKQRFQPDQINLGIPGSMPTTEDLVGTLKGYNLTATDGGLVFAHPAAQFAAYGKAIVAGEGSVLIVCEGAMIHGPTINISSGGLVVIGPYARLRSVNLSCANKSAILIGAKTTWENGAALVDGGKLAAIGADCMFSSGVILRTEDGHGIFDLDTQDRINEPQDVIVGDHVWLGNGVRVNKGSVVHPGTVVGQLSVVSGSLDRQSIYAGVPAKKLRERVAWARNSTFDTVPLDFRS